MMDPAGVDGEMLRCKYGVEGNDGSGCGKSVKSQIDMLYRLKQRIGKVIIRSR
jgi:hypothetical protein